MIDVLNLNLVANKEQILDNISFKTNRNLAVLGTSGAGKTTLFKAISGIIDEGVNLNYQKLFTSHKPNYVFQDCISCFHPYFKIGSQFNIVLPRFKSKALALFKKLGIQKDIWNFYPHQLSRGMGQRVQIALNLLFEAKILICDEITSSLDETNSQIITDILLDLDIQKVIITHDENLAKKICDDVLVLNNGLVEYFGKFKQTS